MIYTLYESYGDECDIEMDYLGHEARTASSDPCHMVYDLASVSMTLFIDIFLVQNTNKGGFDSDRSVK